MWMVTHRIEEGFAHIESRTIEHQRVCAVLDDEIVNGIRISRCEHLVAEVPQRECQKLGDLRRVIDQ